MLVLGGSADRAPDSPGWKVRIVPNKFPALAPPLGRHEVVVHVPRHARSTAELSDSELDLVASAWRSRVDAVRAESFGYVHASFNEGAGAGASLPHTHSQLLSLPELPPEVEAEERLAMGACPVCRMLERELAGRRTRVVFEQDALVAFCREAGRFPYELVVAPTTHEQDGFESPLLGRALALLADCVRRIAAVEGPFPWNAWLRPRGHWRIELLPRLSIPAGIELGAGIYVNSLPPEEAAGRLRG